MRAQISKQQRFPTWVPEHPLSAQVPHVNTLRRLGDLITGVRMKKKEHLEVSEVRGHLFAGGPYVRGEPWGLFIWAPPTW